MASSRMTARWRPPSVRATPRPLHFVRRAVGAAAPAAVSAYPPRPQTPKPPFPYHEGRRRLRQSGQPRNSAGRDLRTIPNGKGPFPAALLITGSGPEDRDETVFGHKPFLVLADSLARRGVAVLRVDDRGVGDSTGSDAATIGDLAGDAHAAVAFLRTRQEIAAGKIGLIGHSEGGRCAAGGVPGFQDRLCGDDGRAGRAWRPDRRPAGRGYW